MNARPAPSSPAAHASTARVRAFLAIRLAPAVHERVAKLKRELASTGAAVRWTRDEGLHVTLKFLGSVAVERLEAIRAILAPLAAEVGAFSARVAGLGAFPTLERPRILWTGVEAPQLARLAAVVDRAAAKLGFPAEERPFHGHVTLGRFKDRSGSSSLAVMLREHGRDDFGSFEVRHVSAFRSDLQRGGSVYTELWKVSLGTSI
jgi:2'-5' RNA ligase